MCVYVKISSRGGQKALNQPELGPSDPCFCCGKEKRDCHPDKTLKGRRSDRFMGRTGLSMKRRSAAVAGGRGKKSLNFQRLRPNNGISNENARRCERERRYGSCVWQED